MTGWTPELWTFKFKQTLKKQVLNVFQFPQPRGHFYYLQLVSHLPKAPIFHSIHTHPIANLIDQVLQILLVVCKKMGV